MTGEKKRSSLAVHNFPTICVPGKDICIIHGEARATLRSLKHRATLLWMSRCKKAVISWLRAVGKPASTPNSRVHRLKIRCKVFELRAASPKHIIRLLEKTPECVFAYFCAIYAVDVPFMKVQLR